MTKQASEGFECKAGLAVSRWPWRGSLIVGSLKAADVYRIEIKDNKFIHKELLIENLGRIRDVEVGPLGRIFFLLEHASGGQIVRVVPQGARVDISS